MTLRVPLFVELCCGSAAVTLRLLGGEGARPPISYMGAKTGYAQAILNVLGLRSGQGADACVLVEAGPWARAWRLLTTPEGCRAVAEVIRGWIGEDARALWERLRAEGAAKSDGAKGVGAWLWAAAVGHHGGGGYTGEFRALGPTQQAHMGATTCAMYAREHGTDERGWPLAPQGCSRSEVATRSATLSALAWPPVQIIEGDVAGVEPRDVAAWLYTQANTRTGTCNAWKSVPQGINVEANTSPRGLHQTMTGVAHNRWGGVDYAALAWPPTTIAQADVAQVQPGTLPPGTVVYMDPPYRNTTGYAHNLPRPQIVEVALRWADAGATVCVSEAEPIEELTALGWRAVEITGCRVGQKRTFSRQKREWLTLNREPAWTPAQQGDIFG